MGGRALAGNSGDNATASGHYSAEFVVVGASFAGLACARNLAAVGRSVLVLEVRDRFGGRVLNQPISGYSGKVVEV